MAKLQRTYTNLAGFREKVKNLGGTIVSIPRSMKPGPKDKRDVRIATITFPVPESDKTDSSNRARKAHEDTLLRPLKEAGLEALYELDWDVEGDRDEDSKPSILLVGEVATLIER